jgi:hypothetical protein
LREKEWKNGQYNLHFIRIYFLSDSFDGFAGGKKIKTSDYLYADRNLYFGRFLRAQPVAYRHFAYGYV